MNEWFGMKKKKKKNLWSWNRHHTHTHTHTRLKSILTQLVCLWFATIVWGQRAHQLKADLHSCLRSFSPEDVLSPSFRKEVTYVVFSKYEYVMLFINRKQLQWVASNVSVPLETTQSAAVSCEEGTWSVASLVMSTEEVRYMQTPSDGHWKGFEVYIYVYDMIYFWPDLFQHERQ